MIDYTQVQNIYNLEKGDIVQIVLLSGNVYQGVIDEVDITEETITIVNGIKYIYQLGGFIESFLEEITIHEGDILCFLSTKQSWTVYKGK